MGFLKRELEVLELSCLRVLASGWRRIGLAYPILTTYTIHIKTLHNSGQGRSLTYVWSSSEWSVVSLFVHFSYSSSFCHFALFWNSRVCKGIVASPHSPPISHLFVFWIIAFSFISLILMRFGVWNGLLMLIVTLRVRGSMLKSKVFCISNMRVADKEFITRVFGVKIVE